MEERLEKKRDSAAPEQPIRCLANILVVANQQDACIRELTQCVTAHGYCIEAEDDIAEAIRRVQEHKFEVIVLDTATSGIRPERAVGILRGLDPQAKIVVKSTYNTKELEAEIRKARVYYYHLDCFGIEELKMAVLSALQGVAPGPQVSTKEVKTMQTKGKILIVDDDADFVEINKRVLETNGYQTAVAYNPEEAWATLSTWQPDLIMLDVMMPTGTEGFHFAYRLRADTQYRHIPVLMVTHINQVAEFRFSPETDGDFLPVEDFIEKPVRPEELVRRVESLLAKARTNPWQKVNTYQGMGLKKQS
ncbi:MAG: response regulator [candidate division KSB1 bacterium]|nr:response regulator [candidate division KSB1 bacterium]MDZ7385938.1 response regulator [candidate division KSB1 bacterium]